MSIVDIQELPDLLPRRARVLGLDFGEKTVGIAVSDRDRRVASPVDTIRRGKFTTDTQQLAAFCREREAAALILGLPVNMDGTEGPRCQATRQFARNLVNKAGFTLPIAYWDERLSTAAVERVLIGEADMSRRKRGNVVDKMAAAYILQGALDALGRDSGAQPRDS